jgi:hypothetical protein
MPLTSPDELATSTYILIAVSFILFILFWCWVFWTIFKNPPQKKTFFQCLPGQCVTDILLGDKNCPVANEMLLYDPEYQVCNSKYTCENSVTPYALTSNGGTNELGVCDPGVTCKCLRFPQCPIDNIVLFNLVNLGSSGTGSIYTQIPIENQGNAGNPPLTYNSNNTQYCAIKVIHLNRLSPGGCRFKDPENIKLSELQECFRLNPCTIGALSFYPKNVDSFHLSRDDKQALTTIPVACVPAINYTGLVNLNAGCEGTTVPIYDIKNQLIKCYNTGFD